MKKVIKVYYVFEENDKKRYKKWCIDNDLQQSKIAKKLDISCSYLNRIILGERVVTPELIEKFREIGFYIKKTKGEKEKCLN